MPIDLATKFQPYTDEQFSTQSKKALLTNQDFDWTGAHTTAPSPSPLTSWTPTRPPGSWPLRPLWPVRTVKS